MKQLFLVIGLLLTLGCEVQMVEVKVMKLGKVPGYSSQTRVHYQLVEYPLYRGWKDYVTSKINFEVGDHYLLVMRDHVLGSIERAYDKNPDYDITDSPSQEEVTPAEKKRFRTEWERQNQQ